MSSESSCKFSSFYNPAASPPFTTLLLLCQVLIPELLYNILSFLEDYGTLYATALVSISWTESLPHVLPFVSSSLRELHLETNADFDSSDPRPRLQTIQGLAGRPDLSLTDLVLIINIDELPGLPAAVGLLLDRQECLRGATLSLFKVTCPIATAITNLSQLQK